jgi:hypothetical protein
VSSTPSHYFEADRSVLDQHPYLAFGVTQNNDPWSAQAGKACSWGGGTNDTQKSFGVTIGGEWSLATNNCGKWLNGVDSVPSYEVQGQGSCKQHEEWFNWDQEYKDGLNSYCQANMDALQNWFFWTWKIGNSTELGYPPSPFWHYQLGLKEGWIPADPRSAGGYCGRAMNIGGAQVRLTSFHIDSLLMLVRWNFSRFSYWCRSQPYDCRRPSRFPRSLASGINGTLLHGCPDRALPNFDADWNTRDPTRAFGESDRSR